MVKHTETKQFVGKTRRIIWVFDDFVMLVVKGLNHMKILTTKKQYSYQAYMQVKISNKYL